MKTLIIGCGNMGQTYARSFLASRFIRPADLFLMSRSGVDITQFVGLPSTNLKLSAGDFISTADIIIIAVKPEDYQKLSVSIAPFIKPDQLVLSIMARITINTIADSLGTKKIVRSMPNIPTQI